MALRKIGNYWHCYFRDLDGKLRTLSTHETDKVSAARFERSIMENINAKRSRRNLMRFLSPEDREKAERVEAEVKANSQSLPFIPAKGSIKLKDMFDLACTYRQLSNDHRKRWSHFCEHVGVKKANEVTAKIARDYLRDNFGSGNGKNYNNYLTALNVIFRLCLIDAGMERSPFADLPRMRITKVKHYRPLTEQEFIQVFNAANIQWKTLSLISWHTGQRFETCVRILKELAIKDVDSITIIPGKTARFGRAVFIPLHPQLREWLNNLRKIYTLKNIQSWSFNTKKEHDDTKRYFSNLLEELGICDTEEGKASFHSLRASFITRCDENNISRKATRGIVGQVSDDTTDLYSHDKESAKSILTLPSLKISM
jgi:integrase